MRLYIWNNPYHVPWGGSFVYAVAENLKEAREQAQQGKMYLFGEFEKPTPQVSLGKPTRVIKLPCAEWFEHSE